MRRNLEIFWLFSVNSIKVTFANKLGVVFFSIGKVMRFVMYYFFIYQLLSHTKVLSGYTLNQTLIFFLTFNTIDGIAQLFFREVYRFRPLIVSGDFNTILVKPYHPFLRILVGGIDILDLLMVIINLSLLAYLITIDSRTHHVIPLLYMILIINALIIATAFHIIVLALGVLTTEVDNITWLYRDISRLGTFSVNIYTEPLRSILTFVIPIGVMMNFPVYALFNSLSPTLIIISFVISLSFTVFSLSLWNMALKRYQSWGG